MQLLAVPPDTFTLQLADQVKISVGALDLTNEVTDEDISVRNIWPLR